MCAQWWLRWLPLARFLLEGVRNIQQSISLFICCDLRQSETRSAKNTERNGKVSRNRPSSCIPFGFNYPCHRAYKTFDDEVSMCISAAPAPSVLALEWTYASVMSSLAVADAGVFH